VASPPIDPIPQTVNPRKGIKKWHQIRSENGKMRAWIASTDEAQGIPEDAVLEKGTPQEGWLSLVSTKEI